MAQAKGTLGAQLWMSNSAADTTVDTESEFFTLFYAQVGLVENFGEFGKQFDLVTFQPVADGRTYKLKGGYNSGQMTVVVGEDLSDGGQSLLAAAASAATQDRQGFRVILGDKTTYYGAGSMFYFLGMVMSFRSNLGAVNNVFKATAVIECDGNFIYLPPGQLWEYYTNGDSIAHWNLYHGSDPEALSPLITGNNFVLTTGNANTSMAVDGTEAVGAATDLVFQLASQTTELVFATTFQIQTDITCAFFMGFTDNNASLEMPIHFPGAALTTVASDAIGFVYDSAAGSAAIRGVAVNNDVDETTVVSATLLTINTNISVEVAITPAGNASFYVNGVLAGTITTACRTNVNLYPVFAALTRNTVSSVIVVNKTYVRGY